MALKLQRAAPPAPSQGLRCLPGKDRLPAVLILSALLLQRQNSRVAEAHFFHPAPMYWAGILPQFRQARNAGGPGSHCVPSEASGKDRPLLPPNTLFTKQECHSQEASEQWLGDFAQEERQVTRTKSSEILSEGNDFIWNREWRSLSLRTLLETVALLVRSQDKNRSHPSEKKTKNLYHYEYGHKNS